VTEDVLKKKAEPGGWFLFREDVLYECEDVGDAMQVEDFGELPDVLCVTGASGQRLHGKEMFG
jgi:hypothetical protein